MYEHQQVLEAVKALLPADRRLQHVVLDFEAAVWTAFQLVFPDAGLRGCFFHYTQAVWRKVQNLGIYNIITAFHYHCYYSKRVTKKLQGHVTDNEQSRVDSN